MANGPQRTLLCTIGTGSYAIPIEHVGETMRPLPVVPVAGAPAFVSGVTVVRGEPLPVVDGALLTEGRTGAASRFVTLRLGARRAVLAVGAVHGIRDLEPGLLRELPPLLEGASGTSSRVGALDAQLLFVLDAMRAVPEALFESLAAPVAAS